MQGNSLVSPDVVKAVAATFQASEGSPRHLADRLIEALNAGQLLGGDGRHGETQSAAVLVADPRPGMSRRPDGQTVNINVCEHPEPVRELRRIYDTASETLGFRTLEQPIGRDVLQLKIMLHALGFFRPGDKEIDVEVAAGERLHAGRRRRRRQVPRQPGLADDGARLCRRANDRAAVEASRGNRPRRRHPSPAAGSAARPIARRHHGGCNHHMNALELDRVSHDFVTPDGRTYRAIDDVSLAIPAGAFVALVGPSGCGKSTLLNLAAGLLTPSSGTRPRRRRRDLAGLNRRATYMFQQDALLPWKNVRDNVALGLTLAGASRGGRLRARGRLARPRRARRVRVDTIRRS